MVNGSARRPRVAYLSGPVDAAAVYDELHATERLAYLGTSYLADWFRVCQDLDADGLVVTTLDGSSSTQTRGSFRIVNVPMPTGRSGPSYHVWMTLWAARATWILRRFDADVMVLTAGMGQAFVLRLAKRRRAAVIAALHCVIWRPYAPPRRLDRFLVRINRRFFRKTTDAVLAASAVIERQVDELVAPRRIPTEVFLPTYAPARFELDPPTMPDAASPFGVFFAGRIEENKGIFDLVEIAAELDQQLPGRFFFHVCGDGSKLEEVRAAVASRALGDIVHLHGFCSGDEIPAIVGTCHAVLVPTRSSFEEGFNMVSAEAVLFRRPVITSGVCPAIEYLGDAVAEVPPDDHVAAREALVHLATSRDTYAAKVAACETARRQFLDPANSYGAKLGPMLARLIGETRGHG